MATQASAEPPSWVGEGLSPYSLAMHIHGSMSEGTGSVHASTAGALLAGVDVIWWSDHDWRVQMYTYVTRASLDAPVEPAWFGEAWSPRNLQESNAMTRLAQVLSDAELADRFDFWEWMCPDVDMAEGAGYCLIGARCPLPNPRLYEIEVEADRRRLIRPLAADISVSVRIRPDVISGDAFPVVHATLSQHENYPGVVDGGVYDILYYLSNTDTVPVLNGRTLRVPLPYIEGEWNDYTLPVSDDATAGFTHLDARDLSMTYISLGISSRNNADGVAGFDDLRVDHARNGEEVFGVQREILADMERFEPGVVHHQGAEFSYFQHLNIFVEDTPLYDYDRMIAESGFQNKDGTYSFDHLRGYSADFVSADIHARGGLVSYNHPFGTANTIVPGLDREQILGELVIERCYGADILEVGYNLRGLPFHDHLWLWDQLAHSGIFMTGAGMSDAHGGNAAGWLTGGANNMYTWVYAQDTSKGALIEGLRRGRAYFGEMSFWGGVLDIRTADNDRMGDIVVTDLPAIDLEYYVNELSPAVRVRVIVNGQILQEQSGFTGETTQFVSVPLEPTGTTIVRVEVYSGGNIPLAISNPIYYRRTVPPNANIAPRLTIDVAGLRSQDVIGFELVGLNVTGEPGAHVVTMSGNAENGTLLFDVSEFETFETVRFGQMFADASWSINGDTLRITNLNGRGSIFISQTVTVPDPCLADCNFDLTVDFSDLICIIFAFGQTDSIADVDQNGTVDFNDLLAALFQFGPCPS
ncbi:MAG: CehA/McbA family metallohydrolase [Phycisphaerales bacterium]